MAKLRIHAHAYSASGLEPGRDLVLDRWAPGDLPDRVLLDDWLGSQERHEIDREARELLGDFSDRHRQVLRCRGVDLLHVWSPELLSEVFLWELRIARGVARAVAAAVPKRIEWHGVDPALRVALEEIVGIRGSVRGSETEAPGYPSSFLTGPNARSGPLRSAVSVTGLPSLIRGTILFEPYRNLTPVIKLAPSRPGLTPVLDSRSVPLLSASQLTKLALRGGWIGAPSAAGKARARGRLRHCLAEAGARMMEGPMDPLERLLAQRSAELLRQRAAESVADHRVAESALARGRVRAVVLPFDTPPGARTLIQAAREIGVPTMVVQHGFTSVPELLQEGSEGDVAAVWSAADARSLRKGARGRVAVTGNPGATAAVRRKPEAGRRGRSIVLVEYPFRPSARIDYRVRRRHVAAALKALEAARRGTEVVIRPHPVDHEPQSLWAVASKFPTLHVTVDATSPLDKLLSSCDLVVGALSTATLEAGARGVRVVYLNSIGPDVPPPFDGSGELLVARNAEELADSISRALAAPEPPGRDEMREALGVREGAAVAVLGEIERLLAPA